MELGHLLTRTGITQLTEISERLVQNTCQAQTPVPCL